MNKTFVFCPRDDYYDPFIIFCFVSIIMHSLHFINSAKLTYESLRIIATSICIVLNLSQSIREHFAVNTFSLLNDFARPR